MVIPVHAPILHKLGPVEAMLWGVLCRKYYRPHMTKSEVEEVIKQLKDEQIKAPADRLEDLIGVKRVAQDRAIKSLEETGYITCKVMGIPATRTIMFTDKGIVAVYQTMCDMARYVETGEN